MPNTSLQINLKQVLGAENSAILKFDAPIKHTYNYITPIILDSGESHSLECLLCSTVRCICVVRRNI